MKTFIKVYDWMSKTMLPGDIKIIFGLILQFWENGKTYYGSIENMAERIGIDKNYCKDCVNYLIQINAITRTKVDTFDERGAIYILKPNLDYIAQFED